MGGATPASVGRALYIALAHMATEGHVVLEHPSGAAIVAMVARAAAALGVAARADTPTIASSCAANNALTFTVLTGASRRRQLREVFYASRAISSTQPAPSTTPLLGNSAAYAAAALSSLCAAANTTLAKLGHVTAANVGVTAGVTWPPGCRFHVGCTHRRAANYDRYARLDDGSCIVGGCTDKTAANFDDAATADDGSCHVANVGCTLAAAFNFDRHATTLSAASCRFERQGCTDSASPRYDRYATHDDGSCVARRVGCADPHADNFGAHQAACAYVARGCTDSTALTYNPLATYDDGSCVPIVRGCTVPTAANFDSAATAYANASCTFIRSGCTDLNALNFDLYAVRSNTSACIIDKPGCSSPLAVNFVTDATRDDGSCVHVVFGCMDSRAADFASNATQPTTCALPGCTHPDAPNYLSYATIDDGSCVPIPSHQCCPLCETTLHQHPSMAKPVASLRLLCQVRAQFTKLRLYGERCPQLQSGCRPRRRLVHRRGA